MAMRELHIKDIASIKTTIGVYALSILVFLNPDIYPLKIGKLIILMVCGFIFILDYIEYFKSVMGKK